MELENISNVRKPILNWLPIYLHHISNWVPPEFFKYLLYKIVKSFEFVSCTRNIRKGKEQNIETLKFGYEVFGLHCRIL